MGKNKPESKPAPSKPTSPKPTVDPDWLEIVKKGGNKPPEKK